MPLVNLNKLIEITQERNTIAPAFNTTNLETTLAIMEAINDSGKPGIIQVTPTNLKLSDYSYISNIVQIAENKFEVPMSLHLDHGKSFEDIKRAVDAGFNSVMIDGADLSFEENIELTRRAVEYCKCFGIPVEAELGVISGKEDDEDVENGGKTDPKTVRQFVEESGCDLLAVSIGNVHGLDDDSSLDFELLDQIKKESKVPLVLHGGSGIPDESLKKVKDCNVVKINIASEIRQKYIQAIGQFYMNDPNEYNLIKVLLAAKDATKEAVFNKIININKLVN